MKAHSCLELGQDQNPDSPFFPFPLRKWPFLLTNQDIHTCHHLSPRGGAWSFSEFASTSQTMGKQSLGPLWTQNTWPSSQLQCEDQSDTSGPGHLPLEGPRASPFLLPQLKTTVSSDSGFSSGRGSDFTLREQLAKSGDELGRRS